MFFDNWWVLGRTLLVGVLGYIALILLLRVTGKRTLSKWNAFDFIVTLALGSTLASLLISREVRLAQGVCALALLMALQFLVTWLSVRVPGLTRLVKSQPRLLLFEGRFRRDAMRSERVTESEMRAALRRHGYGSIDEVAAVVLETDGSFSVIEEVPPGMSSTLQGVAGHEEELSRERV